MPVYRNKANLSYKPQARYTFYYHDNDPSLLRSISEKKANSTTVSLNGQLYRDPLLATAFPNERLTWFLQVSEYDASRCSLTSGQLTISIDDLVNSGTITVTTEASNPTATFTIDWAINSGTRSFFRKSGFMRFTHDHESGLNTLEIFFP